MFERFTDRSRRVMFLADLEAKDLNHEHVGTEHVLLALVKEGSGVGAKVLRNLGVEPRKLHLELKRLLKPGPDMVTIGKLPQTPRVKKAIEHAIEEARNLGHRHVGTEHLLLGLLRDPTEPAARVLASLGLTFEGAREEVRDVVGASSPEPGSSIGPLTGHDPSAGLEQGAFAGEETSTFFACPLDVILRLASIEARRCESPAVMSEHLLLGLIAEPSGRVKGLLSDMGVDLESLKEKIRDRTAE